MAVVAMTEKEEGGSSLSADMEWLWMFVVVVIDFLMLRLFYHPRNRNSQNLPWVQNTKNIAPKISVGKTLVGHHLSRDHPLGGQIVYLINDDEATRMDSDEHDEAIEVSSPLFLH